MEIIAHRGASGYAPENTIAAFKKAIEMGSKSVEFDVQMTLDGELVVIHDYTLERTTNGRGYVMDTTAKDIRSCDAGRWYSDDFIGEKVPLLSEVLDLLPDDMTIHVEIKKAVYEDRDVEKSVLELVNEKKRVDKTIFSSFDHTCLVKLMNMQELKVGVLIASNMIKPIEYLITRGLKCFSINQSDEFINKDLIKDAHDYGLKVLSYTVNDIRTAKRFEEIGVDEIFSNYPDIMFK
ncbi:MAG: glycerophosphodiester phosphodiesterase [Firmicutes bacterium HGW-Firmicutes-7]|nr:MAG: glycerophosphodiester phosphodiesterase [Firmicutes bacterium HGW-Firmicutes-7]